MKRWFVLLILAGSLLILAGSLLYLMSTLATVDNLRERTENVSIYSVRCDISERLQLYDAVADLLYAHHELFIRQEGAAHGSVYYGADPEWKAILNGIQWTEDEISILRPILDTPGLVRIGYVTYKYPQIYFQFYEWNGKKRYHVYSIHKVICEEDGIASAFLTTYQQIQCQINRVPFRDADAFDIMLPNPNWYSTVENNKSTILQPHE